MPMLMCAHDCSVVRHLENKAVRRRNDNILLLDDDTQCVAQQHRLVARYSKLADLDSKNKDYPN